MLYIVEGKAYKKVGDKAKGVNVSATRDPFTGKINSYCVTEVGSEVDMPAGAQPVTEDEFVAKHGCAEKAYKFPASRSKKEQ